MRPRSRSFCGWIIEWGHRDGPLDGYKDLPNESTGGGGVGGAESRPHGSVCDSSLQSTIIKSSTEREGATALLAGSRTVTPRPQSGTQISRFGALDMTPVHREPPVIRWRSRAALRGPSSRRRRLSSRAAAGAAESHGYGAANESWWGR